MAENLFMKLVNGKTAKVLVGLGAIDMATVRIFDAGLVRGTLSLLGANPFIANTVYSVVGALGVVLIINQFTKKQ